MHFCYTSPMDQVEQLLEGHISIEAALEARARPIHKILIQEEQAQSSRIKRQQRNRALAQIQQMAAAQNIPVHRAAGSEIDALANGQSHGGMIALVGPRHFVSMSELLQNRACPFIVMLDGIEDPFNFGQSVRALYAAGATGLVVRPRNWMAAAGVVARASAGATERIATAVAEDADEAADFFRQHGLQVACTGQERAVSLYDADLTHPLFLVLGGEKRGITRSFMRKADLILEIPYGRTYRYSLGAAAATAIIAFETMRQRKEIVNEN